jgi:predicted  nucleic acid-binding Zn-ribbon protein
MLPEIEKLLVIQDRDRRIAQMRIALQNAPGERSVLERQLTSTAAALEAKKSAAKENDLERGKLELEVARRRDQILKFKTQQQQTRKNEEFTAFSNEIAHCETEIMALDDRQIALMEAAEVLAAAVKAATADHAEVQASVKQKISDLETRIKNLENQLAEVVTDRASLVVNWDADLLLRYEKIFVKKGDAVAPLAHGVCGGCHMKVSSSRVMEVRSERQIATCDQCGRILYFTE